MPKIVNIRSVVRAFAHSLLADALFFHELGHPKMLLYFNHERGQREI